jgi:hypothetical protein
MTLSQDPHAGHRDDVLGAKDKVDNWWKRYGGDPPDVARLLWRSDVDLDSQNTPSTVKRHTFLDVSDLPHSSQIRCETCSFAEHKCGKVAELELATPSTTQLGDFTASCRHPILR